MDIKTFNHPIPTRVYLQNGGNIMGKSILLSSDLNDITYKVKDRQGVNGDLLTLINIDKDLVVTAHIEMCWVVADVLVW
jgi:hypothetical protein